MKKLVTILLAGLMIFALAACAGSQPLKDDTHELWVAHGQHKLADGTDNAWGDKDAALYEKSALKAIALSDVKAISQEVYDALSKKDVKYLYTIDLLFGTNDAGWTTRFLSESQVFVANGSFAFKIAKCNSEAEGDKKVYSVDQWISDPKTAYAESLTPKTLFFPVWQEEKDENGFSWSDNPVITAGAGLYTIVVAQYSNASAAGAPGYGIAAILKEAKEGQTYAEEPKAEAFVPADHTYGIVGSFAGSNWGSDGADVAMTKDGDAYKGEVELKANDEFKVRADSDWANSWGDGDNNFKAAEDGTYVVTLTFDANGNGTATAEKK